LPVGAALFGIAQYSPANASMVSTTSASLFMGEVSWTKMNAREVYAGNGSHGAVEACDNSLFFLPGNYLPHAADYDPMGREEVGCAASGGLE
jgi:hypothetical protein